MEKFEFQRVQRKSGRERERMSFAGKGLIRRGIFYESFMVMRRSSGFRVRIGFLERGRDYGMVTTGLRDWLLYARV